MRKTPVAKGIHKKQISYRKRQIHRKVILFFMLAFLTAGAAGAFYGYRSMNLGRAEKIRIDKWNSIFDHPEVYPESFRSALARNPEILDFVAQYPAAAAKTQGGISLAEELKKYPLFLQWDERWGFVSYGQSNIGISGCGPTCLSMVLYSLTRDKTLTPDALAARAMNEGYYVDGIGTAWSFMSDISTDYGVFASQFSMLGEEEMKDRLDDGNLLICAMGPGDFTDQGHFIVIRGYSKEGFEVNDPFSRSNSDKKWTYEALAPQIRQVWVYAD